jgi:hypothetical protein
VTTATQATAVYDERTIAPSEVRDWFGRRPPGDCVELAVFLTSMRWPTDPPRPALPSDAREWYWREQLPGVPRLPKPVSVGAKEVCDFEQPTGRSGGVDGEYEEQDDGSWLLKDITWEEPQARCDRWWDLNVARAAAEVLQAAIPKMITY